MIIRFLASKLANVVLKNESGFLLNERAMVRVLNQITYLKEVRQQLGRKRIELLKKRMEPKTHEEIRYATTY